MDVAFPGGYSRRDSVSNTSDAQHTKLKGSFCEYPAKEVEDETWNGNGVGVELHEFVF